MRKAEISRKTLETSVKIRLNIDGSGKSSINSGIGFFDHMLTLFAKHGSFDIDVSCNGDLNVDGHHSVEDIGITLGDAFCKALGKKESITRYGSFYVPMDEALAFAAVDISGRPFIVYDSGAVAPMIGEYDTELTEEFLRAFAFHAGITLHAKVLYGTNSHHKIEAVFKALGHAMKIACQEDKTIKGVLSTKGTL